MSRCLRDTESQDIHLWNLTQIKIDVLQIDLKKKEKDMGQEGSFTFSIFHICYR